MTKEEAKQTALHWLDEATSGGRPLEAESTADLLERMDHLLDGAVAAVCGRFPHHEVYRAVCLPPRNLAPGEGGLQQVWPPQALTVDTPPFYSYTLEVQGAAQLALYGGGQLLEERELPGRQGQFVPVQGVLTRPADRLRLCGRTPFAVRGIGLYPDIYPPGEVPPWQPWVPLKLPADAAALEQVQYSGDGTRFARFSEYRRIRDGEYAVPRRLAGQLDFHYIRAPRAIGPAAAPETQLDVEPAAACLVPLRLAADVIAGVDETAVLATYLTGRYNDMAGAILRAPEPERAAIECVYAP